MWKDAKSVPYLILAASLAAFLFALLPALTYNSVSIDGYEVAIGGTIVNVDPFDLGAIAEAKLPFSWLVSAVYVLPLIGGLFIMVHRKTAPVACLLFGAAIIMGIMVPNHVVIEYTILGVESSASIDWSMGEGLLGSLAATFIAFLLAVGLLK